MNQAIAVNPAPLTKGKKFAVIFVTILAFATLGGIGYSFYEGMHRIDQANGIAIHQARTTAAAALEAYQTSL